MRRKAQQNLELPPQRVHIGAAALGWRGIADTFRTLAVSGVWVRGLSNSPISLPRKGRSNTAIPR